MNKTIMLFTLSISSIVYSGNLEQVKDLSFKNVNCLNNNSCDLKSFNLKVYDKVDLYNSDHGLQTFKNSYMEGSFEVSDKSKLKDFAVVQYIKGCMFAESQNNNGPKEIFKNVVSRDFFGESINFRHPKFVIDSFDKDPIYSSMYDKADRHGYYKIKNDESKSVIFDDKKYFDIVYNNPRVIRPIMHFSDMPTGSLYSEVLIEEGQNQGQVNKWSQVASMAFTTCIYKTSDVPLNLRPSDTNKSKAIKCFDWSNSHKYNKSKKSFVSTVNIDNECL